MIKNLTAGTDAGTFALCDAGFARQAEKATRRTLEPHVTAGEALLYSAGGDGDVCVRLLLDEPMPGEFQPKIREQQRDLLLRLPTGRLFLCGLEDLGRKAEIVLSHSAAASCTADLAPGDYLADACILDWGEEPDSAAICEEKQILESRVSPGRRKLTFCLGILAVLILFGTPVALFVAHQIGGWIACAKTFGVIAVVYLLFSGITLLVARHPSQKAYGDALRRREEILARFPDLVVQLKRLPAGSGPGEFKGGRLGAGS
jgi:hypothetical protein